MKDIKVKFYVKEYENGVKKEIQLNGTIIDRYSDIVDVNQKFPSGHGGFIIIEDHKMNKDFYLILSDNGQTYRIPCANIKIEP